MKSRPQSTALWWKLDEPDDKTLADAVVSRGLMLLEGQSVLHSHFVKLRGVYSACNPGKLSSMDRATRLDQMKRMAQSAGSPSILNVTKQCIDAICAMVTKTKPRVRFVTDGADWSDQLRAKRMTTFCDGNFEDGGAYKAHTLATFDSAIYGTGAVKWVYDDGDLTAERTPLYELAVDPADAANNCPTELFQVRSMTRSTIMDHWPDRTDDLRGISGWSEDDDLNEVTDVVECWKLLKSGGKHVIAVDDVVLLQEDWDSPRFPFVFHFWDSPESGFWGTGVAQELAKPQHQLNQLLNRFNRSTHMMAAPKWFAPTNSNINLDDLNNEVAGIVEHDGPPPVPAVPGAVFPQDARQMIDFYYQRCFEIAGISELNAHGEKPAGLDSGAAQREYQDTQSQRFSVIEKQYHDAYVESARIVIDLQRMFAGTGRVKLIDDRAGLAELDWADVELDDKRFVMRGMPASLLPATPSGKLAKVGELMDNKLMDRTSALMLLDAPDISRFTETETAMRRAAEAQVERVLESMSLEGNLPSRRMSVEECMTVARQRFNMEIAKTKPDSEMLDLLDTYIGSCESMMPPPPAEPVPAQPTQAEIPPPA